MKSVRGSIVSLSCVAFVLWFATGVSAQPILSATPIEVPPGGSVTVTITGLPGQAWGLGGSLSGYGLVYAGLSLSLGADAVALGSGVLDGSGAASVTFKPPIGPNAPLYYLQGITAADFSFAGAQATQSITLRPLGIFNNTPVLPQGLSAGNARILGLADPVEASDAATKAYVDSVAGGSAQLNNTNFFTELATFASGLSAGNGRIQNVATPYLAADAVNKAYVDGGFARLFIPNSASTVNPLLSLEQTGAGELLHLRVKSSSVPGQLGTLLDEDLVSIRSDGGFVFGGVVDVGTIPATGPGARTQWYPKKAAFRTGYVASGSDWDDVNIGFSSFAGGTSTVASGTASFAFGLVVQATGTHAAGFGAGNSVAGEASFTAGKFNVTQGFASIALGSSVAACGDYSVALGYLAATATGPTANNRCGGTALKGSFIFSDQSSQQLYFTSAADNEFAARASGGFRFRTNSLATTGCNLPAGSGVFSCSSDRNLKSGFWTLDGEDVLRKVAAIPVTRWHFNDEAAGVTHVGPTAQDFHAAFGLGETDTMIGYTDINGINMRAIQALEARTRDLQAAEQRVRALEQRLAKLEAAIESLLGSRQ